MRRALVAILALAVGVFAASLAAASTGKGSLRVVVTRGPITPVCKVGVPCDGPAKGVRIVVRRNGAVVARGLTDALGRTRFALVGGRYAVAATYSGGVAARAESKPARVVAGRTTIVAFSFDTGIR
jgi:hypothetical protein